MDAKITRALMAACWKPLVSPCAYQPHCTASSPEVLCSHAVLWLCDSINNLTIHQVLYPHSWYYSQCFTYPKWFYKLYG